MNILLFASVIGLYKYKLYELKSEFEIRFQKYIYRCEIAAFIFQLLQPQICR